MLKKHRFLIYSVIWTGIIGFLSLSNPGELPEVKVSNFDKIAHFGVYFLLTILWFLFLVIEKNKTKIKAIAIAAAFSFFYGLLMEFAQAQMTETRTGDYLDAIANTVGIVFAVILCVKQRKV